MKHVFVLPVCLHLPTCCPFVSHPPLQPQPTTPTQGYEDEVAQVGGSLASYFDVYHRLLASRLSAAAQAHDAKQLRSIAREIAGSSVDNQHTYVHAQQLLSGK